MVRQRTGDAVSRPCIVTGGGIGLAPSNAVQASSESQKRAVMTCSPDRNGPDAVTPARPDQDKARSVNSLG
jgi:hypothetical protein